MHRIISFHFPFLERLKGSLAKDKNEILFSEFGMNYMADIGWPTGNGEKLSNSQACCLAKLGLAAA